MNIPESITAEFIIQRIVNRYATCVDCASEARAKALCENDYTQKNLWNACGDFHESRADVLFDVLKVIAGSEDLAAEWVNDNDC